MKKSFLATIVLGGAVLCLAAAACPPPDDAPPPPRKDAPPPPPPPPPRFELGRVLPPHFRDELDLTEAQETELDDLEREVRARVLKMLTAEQRVKLQDLKRRRPGPPPGGKPNEPGRNVNPW